MDIDLKEAAWSDSVNAASRQRRTARPWGYFQTVDAGDGFLVKRIVVDPGGRLSLQMHHHRAEHWVVVAGVALVTRGDEVMSLHQNESVFIAVRQKHRLENPGEQPLHVVEVQTGDYLGEDDIVRFEDCYGRS
jgi:mannose-1-phosphate guanylyltransferase/mannose-6-phosphate isomerase